MIRLPSVQTAVTILVLFIIGYLIYRHPHAFGDGIKHAGHSFLTFLDSL